MKHRLVHAVPRIYNWLNVADTVKGLGLREGLQLDVRDNVGKWVKAEIKRENRNLFLIDYLGWPSIWNEWIDATVEGDRFAKLDTYSRRNVKEIETLPLNSIVDVYSRSLREWYTVRVTQSDGIQVQVTFAVLNATHQYWFPVTSDEIHLQFKPRRFHKAQTINTTNSTLPTWRVVQNTTELGLLIRQGTPSALIKALELARSVGDAGLDTRMRLDGINIVDYWTNVGDSSLWNWSALGGKEREKSVMTELFEVLIRTGSRPEHLRLPERISCPFVIPLLYSALKQTSNLARQQLFIRLFSGNTLAKFDPTVTKSILHEVLANTSTDELNRGMPLRLIDALKHETVVVSMLERLPELELEARTPDGKSVWGCIVAELDVDEAVRSRICVAFEFMRLYVARTSDQMRETLTTINPPLTYDLLDIVDEYAWREFPPP